VVEGGGVCGRGGRGVWWRGEGCVVEGGGVCGGGAAAPRGGRDARAGSNIIHLLNGRGEESYIIYNTLAPPRNWCPFSSLRGFYWCPSHR
jgi:hypothetical protein